MAEDFKIDVAEIKNVEIAETGVWNGIKVKDTDLDEMVSNFQAGVIEPYLNLDHNDKFTDRVKDALSVISLGFVSQLKRVGNKLVADFVQVPKKIAELIKAGMLKKRSIEFFPKGFSVNGKVFNNVLKAVSFFGGDVPAINSLSNDFDVLLKSDKYAVNFSDVQESKKIIFHKEKDMDKIEVSKNEHDELVSFKASANAEIAKLKTDNEKLVETNTDLSAKLKDAEKANAELVEFKAKMEEDKKATIKADAEKFVNGLVESGKLLPKYKELKIEDYISKAGDNAKLSLFKEELESRDKIVNLGELKGEEGEGNSDTSNMTTDEIAEAIEARMKKTNEPYEKAAAYFGIRV